MDKTVNITVRLDPQLKEMAEIACQYMDTTISNVIRKALKDIIHASQQASIRETQVARQFIEGENAQLAYDALARDIQSQGGGLVDYPTRTFSKPMASSEPVTNTEPEMYVHGTNKSDITPKLSENGDIDPSTMPRKLRRQFERDRQKGRI